VLVLTGEGSVFEELFSRSGVCSKPIFLFLHVADYMIALIWQSCCGERAGSHINLTKTTGRTGLGDETFDSLVFNTFNIPHLNEMDFAAFVKRLSDEGHQTGTTKAGMGKAWTTQARAARATQGRQNRWWQSDTLRKKTRTFLFVKWKPKCAKSKPRFALRAQSTNNGALPALSIKATLRALSKTRCAINQSRASRAIKSALRAIKAALRA